MSKPDKIGEPNPQEAFLLACWECKTELGRDAALPEHFCHECGKVQPLPGESDYFQFFGLTKKLGLNGEELEKLFHQLSWKLHPDRFHNATTFERELSMERTAALNDAYRVLRDPVKRTEYLLRLEGVRKEGEVKQQAPPDLLEEVFELNEHLEELRGAKQSGGDERTLDDLRHQLEKAREAFQQKMDGLLEELAAAFARWDELAEKNSKDSAAKSVALNGLNEILNRHNYIRNLVEKVKDELES